MTLHPERNEARIPRSHTQQERYDLEMAHITAVVQHLKEMRTVLADMMGHTVAHGNRIIQVPPPSRPYLMVSSLVTGLNYCNTTIPILEQQLMDLEAKR